MASFDELLGGLVNRFETQVLPGLLSNVFSQSQFGSLQGGLDALTTSGFGPQVHSWLGQGANELLTPQQLQSALGESIGEKLSSALGVPPNEVFGILAQYLPKVIDMLSPNGTLNPPTPPK